MEGAHFQAIRRKLRLFERRSASRVTVEVAVDTEAPSRIGHLAELQALFCRWAGQGTQGSSGVKVELDALHRLHAFPQRSFGTLVTIAVRCEDRLIAYSMNELIGTQHAINHFHKSDLSLPGLSTYTFYRGLEAMHALGVDSLNFHWRIWTSRASETSRTAFVPRPRRPSSESSFLTGTCSMATAGRRSGSAGRRRDPDYRDQMDMVSGLMRLGIRDARVYNAVLSDHRTVLLRRHPRRADSSTRCKSGPRGVPTFNGARRHLDPEIADHSLVVGVIPPATRVIRQIQFPLDDMTTGGSWPAIS